MDLSPPHLPSSAFFQPVLSGYTESNVEIFEGILLLSYALERWEKIFQLLEAEAQKTLMMLSEGNMISKGGVVNITKRTVSFTKTPPEEMSLSGGKDTISLLRKWNHCYQEDKSLLCGYQETLKGDVLNLQAMIGRGGMYEER